MAHLWTEIQLCYIVSFNHDTPSFPLVFEGGKVAMRWVQCVAALTIATAPALAADPSDVGVSMDLDVVAKQLDIARQQIQPSLGATTYTFSPQSLEDIPQGDNAPLNQVLLQAPGVAQDSFGQIHLRGEHANVQYRLNGVELPEGLSVFGQAIENDVEVAQHEAEKRPPHEVSETGESHQGYRQIK